MLLSYLLLTVRLLLDICGTQRPTNRGKRPFPPLLHKRQVALIHRTNSGKPFPFHHTKGKRPFPLQCTRGKRLFGYSTLHRTIGRRLSPFHRSNGGSQFASSTRTSGSKPSPPPSTELVPISRSAILHRTNKRPSSTLPPHQLQEAVPHSTAPTTRGRCPPPPHQRREAIPLPPHQQQEAFPPSTSLEAGGRYPPPPHKRHEAVSLPPQDGRWPLPFHYT